MAMAISLSGLLFGGAAASAQEVVRDSPLKAAHGHVERALKSLEGARKSKQEFGGHLEAAIEHLRQAHQEIHDADELAKEHPAR